MYYFNNDTSSLPLLHKMLVGVIVAIFSITMLFPSTASAAIYTDIGSVVSIYSAHEPDLLTKRFEMASIQDFSFYKPQTDVLPAGAREMTVASTAYTSAVAQTDSTPCITADGYNVCAAAEENVVAANFLPFGTKIMIPDVFGDRIFTVHDRMNRRYYYRVDVWMMSYNKAIQYGKRDVRIIILPS